VLLLRKLSLLLIICIIWHLISLLNAELNDEEDNSKKGQEDEVYLHPGVSMTYFFGFFLDLTDDDGGNHCRKILKDRADAECCALQIRIYKQRH
jgi:hypothetical protein